MPKTTEWESRIRIGLPRPLKESAKDSEFDNSTEGLLADFQRVTDFDTFYEFIEKYGVFPLFRHVDQSVNRALLKWTLGCGQDETLSEDFLEAVSFGGDGVVVEGGCVPENMIEWPERMSPRSRERYLSGSTTGPLVPILYVRPHIGIETFYEMLESDRALGEVASRIGGEAIRIALNRLQEEKKSNPKRTFQFAMTALWDKRKRKFTHIASYEKSGPVRIRWGIEDDLFAEESAYKGIVKITRMSLWGYFKYFYKAEEKNRLQTLRLAWEEERERLLRLNDELHSILEVLSNMDLSNSKPQATASVPDLERLLRFVKVELSVSAGENGRYTIKIDPPTLEAAIFLTVFERLTCGFNFRKCRRKACTNYLSTRNPIKIYCTGCQVKRNSEERTPIHKKRNAIRSRAHRRFEKQIIDKNERSEMLAKVNKRLRAAQSSKDLEVVVEEFGLETSWTQAQK